MNTRYSINPATYSHLNTDELRQTFLIEDMFQPDSIPLTYWESDRTIIGSAVPTKRPLQLTASEKEMAAKTFCERREVGVINLGGSGYILVDGTSYPMPRLDALYIGRGAEEIFFHSEDPAQPARFYLISYPAHTAYPTTPAPAADANRLILGSGQSANERILFQQIYEGGVQSCQLVMGHTMMQPGSVWNTMPGHTHQRRSEVYLYFDVPSVEAVFHMMGPAQETRHLLVHNEQAVMSPIWSMHAGCGTSNYGFVWAMGGENQRFDDMDGIPVNRLK